MRLQTALCGAVNIGAFPFGPKACVLAVALEDDSLPEGRHALEGIPDYHRVIERNPLAKWARDKKVWIGLEGVIAEREGPSVVKSLPLGQVEIRQIRMMELPVVGQCVELPGPALHNGIPRDVC